MDLEREIEKIKKVADASMQNAFAEFIQTVCDDLASISRGSNIPWRRSSMHNKGASSGEIARIDVKFDDPRQNLECVLFEFDPYRGQKVLFSLVELGGSAQSDLGDESCNEGDFATKLIKLFNKTGGDDILIARKLLSHNDFREISADFGDQTVDPAQLEPRVRKLIEYIDKLQDEHWDEMGFTHVKKNEHTFTKGGRYWRIVKSDGTSRSVWGFVDTTNGDILKAASWRVPAKHARGNVFDPSSWRHFSNYGPQYLK
jgi:hypothetical protein